MDPTILVLSTADWNRPLWTNKQHLASRLGASVPVVYVNSLALRRPGFDLADLRRGVGAVRASVLGRPETNGELPPRLRVVAPRVIPFHRRRPGIWRFNRWSLRSQIGDWLTAGRRVLWTFSPVTYDLEHEAALTVYHCVDLLGTFPGVDPVAIDEGERRLAAHGAVGVASSAPVADHLRAQGFRDVLLWENVADTELFAAGSVGPREPAVVFAGNLTPTKVDVALLRAIADTGLTLHLAGPVSEGGGVPPDLAWCDRAENVVLHGTLRPDELAELFGRCTVGIVPYLRNDYTAGVFPMKVYEYLAGGLAVVTTALPALEGSPDVVWVAGDATDFVEQVRAVVDVPGDEEIADRRRRASAHSWDARAEDALALIASRCR